VGTGRLVRVSVHSATRAVFSGRHVLAGSGLALPALAELTGEARVEEEGLRVVVYTSALSVLVVGALSAVFLFSGLHVFFSRPGLGTGIAGGLLLAVGSWLLQQIPRTGREVAADVARVLEAMARTRRPELQPGAASQGPGGSGGREAT